MNPSSRSIHTIPSTPSPPHFSSVILVLCVLWVLSPAPARAAGTLDASRVVVVFNHHDPDSVAVRQAYLRAHPGALDLDLAEPALVGRPTIDPAIYKEMIQNPIRRWMAAERGRAERIVVILLTRGVPHRIDDMNESRVGDAPAKMETEWLEKGDFTAASVDSELTLLWQELDRNEKGGRFDSAADGFVLNPYYASTEPITAYRRRSIMRAKRLTQPVPVGERRTKAEPNPSPQPTPPTPFTPPQGGWTSPNFGLTATRLTPGDIYLVARIDGATLADALALINRARELKINPRAAAIVLDGAEAIDLDQGDYARTAEIMSRRGWRVVHDRAERFLTAADLEREIGLPVLAYAGYGRNDQSPGAPEDPGYIRQFRFAPGAVFNTLESFNAKMLGGETNRLVHPQTQIADFVAAGGTFAVGSVWEPFSFSAPENALLLDGFFNRGLTWVESAYRSMKALSWQQVVVGDPLARAHRAPNE